MPRIYCIEGHADFQPDDVWEVNTLVQSQLQAVHDCGGLPFTRRNCATLGEMHFWLRRDWLKGDNPREAGSVLYFSTHGAPGEISLSAGQSQEISTLSDDVGKGFASGCVVHFGGCAMVKGRKRVVREFMRRSGASAVSGFTKTVNYLGVATPALTLEANYLYEISYLNLDALHQRETERKRMRDVAKKLQDAHPKCGFELWLANERKDEK